MDHDEDITDLVTNEGYNGPSNIFKILEIDITNTDVHEQEGKNEEKTFLVVPAYQNLSSTLRFKFLLHPEFYLSTALSASLHKQENCLQDLEQGIINYYQDRCFNYIGNDHFVLAKQGTTAINILFCMQDCHFLLAFNESKFQSLKAQEKIYGHLLAYLTWQCLLWRLFSKHKVTLSSQTLYNSSWIQAPPS